MNRTCLLTGLIGVLAITACGEKRAETSYEEPVAAQSDVPTAAPVQQSSEIHWHIPSGWQKESASDGITAMSYSLGNARLTVTPLQGSAGGVEANIQRWRRQAGLPPFSAEELKTEIKEVATQAGTAQVVKIANSDGAAKQIFAAILPYQGTTWFVKMTGPSAELNDTRWQELQELLKTAHPGSH